MNIYFAGAIRSGREKQAIYEAIIKILKKYGKVLTEHVGNKNLTLDGERLSDQKIYKRDMKFFKDTDVLVAEISTPSLGVGYEIARAEMLGKKVLCLYNLDAKHKISGIIGGDPNVTLQKYANISEAEKFIEEFFKSLH